MSGLSSMIQLAAHLEAEHGLFTLSIGAGSTAQENHVVELCGRFLLYRISLRVDQIIVAASLMDAPGEPQLLLRESDTQSGWKIAGQLVATLEKYGIKSLVRPIEAGLGKPDGIIIF